jgi:hypothetical protein
VATLYYRKEQEKVIDMLLERRFAQRPLGIFYPVILVDGPLFKLTVDDGKLNAAPIGDVVHLPLVGK